MHQKPHLPAIQLRSAVQEKAASLSVHFVLEHRAKSALSTFLSVYLETQLGLHKACGCLCGEH
jgi:hypothetical protein